MNTAIDATQTVLAYTDLPEDQCPDGILATGVATLATTAVGDVGVWEHPIGTSTDVEADEVFVVLSGRGRVIFADGHEIELAPGTVGILEAGAETTWIVEEPLRKVWLVPR